MDIIKTIQKVISIHAEGRLIKYDDILIEKGIDSLMIIQIVIELEEIFSLEFDSARLNYKTLKSIRTISEYVQLEIGDSSTNEKI